MTNVQPAPICTRCGGPKTRMVGRTREDRMWQCKACLPGQRAGSAAALARQRSGAGEVVNGIWCGDASPASRYTFTSALDRIAELEAEADQLRALLMRAHHRVAELEQVLDEVGRLDPAVATIAGAALIAAAKAETKEARRLRFRAHDESPRWRAHILEARAEAVARGAALRAVARLVRDLGR